MKITKAMWQQYLTECDYQPGDCVMYFSGRGKKIELYKVEHPYRPEAEFFSETGDIPLRIFTPDGKRQKGKDFVPPPSKREQVRNVLIEVCKDYYGYRSVFGYDDYANSILKICEVAEDAE